MSNIVNDYFLGVFMDTIYDPVITNAYAIQLFRSTQLDRLTRKRIVFECLDTFQDPRDNWFGQAAKILFGGWLEDDLIEGHSFSADVSSL